MKTNRIIPAALAIAAFALAASASAQTPPSVDGASTTASHGRMEGRMSTTTRMENQQEHAQAMDTRIEGRSDSEVGQRIDRLNKEIARIQSMTRIASSSEESLVASLQSEIAGLTSLKSEIDAGNASTSDLRSEARSIATSYRIYMLVLPQANLVASADRVLTIASELNAVAAKVSSAAGSSTSAASALSDLAAKTADATSQANAAIAEISGLQPDQGATSTMEANASALKDARSKIQAATQDLVAARKDIQIAIDAIKGTAHGRMSTTTDATSTQ